MYVDIKKCDKLNINDFTITLIYLLINEITSVLEGIHYNNRWIPYHVTQNRGQTLPFSSNFAHFFLIAELIIFKCDYMEW